MMLTPISASSLTDSKTVTLWRGFAILVEIAADNPARPAPIIITCIDMLGPLLWFAVLGVS